MHFRVTFNCSSNELLISSLDSSSKVRCPSTLFAFQRSIDAINCWQNWRFENSHGQSCTIILWVNGKNRICERFVHVDFVYTTYYCISVSGWICVGHSKIWYGQWSYKKKKQRFRTNWCRWCFYGAIRFRENFWFVDIRDGSAFVIELTVSTSMKSKSELRLKSLTSSPTRDLF